MSDSAIKVSLDIATSAAEKALERVQAQANKTNQAFEVFKGTLGGGLILGAIEKLGSVLTGTFQAAIKEAMEAESEINNLNVALKNSGIYSEQTSKNLQDYADSIAETTVYTDGAVKQNLALLASMTNLDENGLKRAQSAAVDLSAAYNIDLQTATQLVAKASNGQTVGLSKLGVEFTKTGSNASTFANVLQSLEKLQGSAAAKTNTFEGRMAQLRNASDKLLESIGNMIVQNPFLIKGLENVVSGLITASKWMDSFNQFIQSNIGWLEPLAFGLTAAGFALAVIAVKAAIASGAFTVLATTATSAWAAVTSPVALVVAGVGLVGAALYAVVKYWDFIKAGAYNALAATLEFASKGASAIGASGASEALQKQAQAYRSQAVEARLAGESKINADNQVTAVQESNNKKRSDLDKEQAQREADLAEKRQKEIDDYTLKLAKQTEDIKAQNDLRFEAMQIQFENEALLESEWDLTRFDASLAREEEFIARKQEALDLELQANLERIEKSRASEDDKYNARLQLEQKYNNESQRLSTDLNKKTIENRKAREAEEKKFDEQRLTASQNLFGALADVAANGGAESFGIWKALAISEATIAGYLAIQKALASAPPPFNFVAAAAVGIQTGLQLSKISTTQPPKFEQGGIVGGNSFSGDQITARVNSGEMILNKNQQGKLFQLANGGGNQVEGLLVELIQAVREGTRIEIDGREVFAAMRDASSSGRTF